jgi:hypothetical protein
VNGRNGSRPLARIGKILMLQSEREHFLFANPANMLSHNTATKVWNYRLVNDTGDWLRDLL